MNAAPAHSRTHGGDKNCKFEAEQARQVGGQRRANENGGPGGNVENPGFQHLSLSSGKKPLQEISTGYTGRCLADRRQDNAEWRQFVEDTARDAAAPFGDVTDPVELDRMAAEVIDAEVYALTQPTHGNEHEDGT